MCVVFMCVSHLLDSSSLYPHSHEGVPKKKRRAASACERRSVRVHTVERERGCLNEYQLRVNRCVMVLKSVMRSADGNWGFEEPNGKRCNLTASKLCVNAPICPSSQRGELVVSWCRVITMQVHSIVLCAVLLW